MASSDPNKRAEAASYMESKVPFSCANCDWITHEAAQLPNGKVIAYCKHPMVEQNVDIVYGCCNYFVNKAALIKAAGPVWFVGESRPRKV